MDATKLSLWLTLDWDTVSGRIPHVVRFNVDLSEQVAIPI